MTNRPVYDAEMILTSMKGVRVYVDGAISYGQCVQEGLSMTQNTLEHMLAELAEFRGHVQTVINDARQGLKDYGIELSDDGGVVQ